MISVSYLKSIYDKKTTIRMIDESIADMIHVDLMDGMYTENNNLDIDEVLNDLMNTKKPLDIHLMVMYPEKYIHDLAKLKPYAITIHLKTSEDTKETLELIKEYNIKCGIAINPNEDIKLIHEYLDILDYVLIMGVIPGKGGQKFIPEVLEKLDYLKDKNILVGIDGGVNDESIKKIKKYNIDNIISGSFVTMNEDFNERINRIKEIIG